MTARARWRHGSAQQSCSCRNSIPLCKSLAGDLVVEALDVPVHAQDLLVAQATAALAFHGFAVLIHDRALERMKLAGADRLFGIHRHSFHVVSHVGYGAIITMPEPSPPR
jgi:hypothetical protein